MNDEFLTDDQFAMKSEGFDMVDGALEMNGKLCGESLEDALLADPDCCGICG